MVIVTMCAILICRLFSVGVPVFICWLCSGCKPLKLKWTEWVFVYFGGLIRGAICFGLTLTITSDNAKVIATTAQICALSLIVGIGSPLQLIAYVLGVKPDGEVAEEEAKLIKNAEGAEKKLDALVEEAKG